MKKQSTNNISMCPPNFVTNNHGKAYFEKFMNMDHGGRADGGLFWPNIVEERDAVDWFLVFGGQGRIKSDKGLNLQVDAWQQGHSATLQYPSACLSRLQRILPAARWEVVASKASRRELIRPKRGSWLGTCLWGREGPLLLDSVKAGRWPGETCSVRFWPDSWT
ncbi:hypothetical protein HKD37_U059019 [Glycine soja]